MNYGIEEVVLGGGFVVLYSLDRFNVPSTSRSSTTVFRFYSGSALYGIVSVGIFTVLTRFQSLVPALFEGQDPPKYLASLSSPFAAALLMTVLLPNVPWLSAVDKRLRETIQRLAEIPTEALRLSHRLQKAPFSPTPDQLQRATQTLEDQSVPMAGLKDPRPQAVLAAWLKVTVILQHIDELQGSAWAGSFLVTKGATLTEIRQRYDGISDEVRDYLSMTAAALMNESQGRLAVDRLGRTVASRADDLLKHTSDLVSQAVLHCSYTRRQRRQRLEGFGFRPDQDEKMLSFDQYVQLFLALTLLILLGSLIQAYLGVRPTMRVLLLKSTFCSFVVTQSVACATLPIGLWRFASLRDNGQRPWLFYLVSGLGAVFLAAVGTFAVFYLGTFDFGSSWLEVRQRAAWLILAFSIAGVTAYQVHSKPLRAWTSGRLRVAHAVAQAATLSLACVLVYYDLWAQHLFDRAEAVLPLMPTMALAGAIIGSLVPPWFRDPVPDSGPGVVTNPAAGIGS